MNFNKYEIIEEFKNTKEEDIEKIIKSINKDNNSDWFFIVLLILHSTFKDKGD